jgi:hypothetical protein
MFSPTKLKWILPSYQASIEVRREKFHPNTREIPNVQSPTRESLLGAPYSSQGSKHFEVKDESEWCYNIK